MVAWCCSATPLPLSQSEYNPYPDNPEYLEARKLLDFFTGTPLEDNPKRHEQLVRIRENIENPCMGGFGQYARMNYVDIFIPKSASQEYRDAIEKSVAHVRDYFQDKHHYNLSVFAESLNRDAAQSLAA